MKKTLSLALSLILVLFAVSAFAAEAWTVTCPWAPSGGAAMVSQKAASLSTTHSDEVVLVATAEKGDAATLNSWITRVHAGDPEMIFAGEGLFGITSILDPERMQFAYEDFAYVENLYSSVFVLSANAANGIDSLDALEAFLKQGNEISVATNGATGSEAFLAAALIGAMGYGEQLSIIPYESAAEAAQAAVRGETDLAVSHQSQILESAQQGGVKVIAAFDGEDIAKGPFAGVEGVGKRGYPFFRNRCFIFTKAGADPAKVEALRGLYGKILSDPEMVSWLNETMLLEADPMTEAQVQAHLENVKAIVTEYYDLVAE